MVSLLLIALSVPQAATPTPTPAVSFPISVLKAKQGEERGSGGQSLAEIARNIRLNIPPGEKPVLNNETIKTWSKGVELTTAAPSSPRATGGSSAAARHQEASKASWQRRFQEARGKALYWEAEVKRLEAESAKLESDFYARDDPAYRDGVIKPAWDKARADLERARKEAEASRQAPDQVLASAQRDGAEPGWFRGLPEPGPVSGATPTPTPKGAKPPRPVKVEPLH